MDKLLKQLSSKYKKDIRVIKHVANHPFKFIRNGISSPLTNDNYRLRYLGVFANKRTATKTVLIEGKITKLLEKYAATDMSNADIGIPEGITLKDYLYSLRDANDRYLTSTMSKIRHKIFCYTRNISKSETKEA